LASAKQLADLTIVYDDRLSKYDPETFFREVWDDAQLKQRGLISNLPAPPDNNQCHQNRVTRMKLQLAGKKVCVPAIEPPHGEQVLRESGLGMQWPSNRLDLVRVEGSWTWAMIYEEAFTNDEILLIHRHNIWMLRFKPVDVCPPHYEGVTVSFCDKNYVTFILHRGPQPSDKARYVEWYEQDFDPCMLVLYGWTGYPYLKAYLFYILDLIKNEEFKRRFHQWPHLPYLVRGCII
jgi:hypothetical protein